MGILREHFRSTTLRLLIKINTYWYGHTILKLTIQSSYNLDYTWGLNVTFTSLHIFCRFRHKKRCCFCLFFNSCKSQKKQCHLVPKEYSQIWKYTDFLKLLTVLISPDLIGHQQHQNHPKFTFAVQYSIKQQVVVHTGSKNPTATITKHNQPLYYHPWKAIRLMQPVCLSLFELRFCCPETVGQSTRRQTQSINSRDKNNYWSCATI